MENMVFYTNLFDAYEQLLTEKERDVFKDYYFENLSMQEIADNNKVSKSAVYKTLQSAIEKLDKYESYLKIIKKNEMLNEALKCADKEGIIKIINDVLSV